MTTPEITEEMIEAGAQTLDERIPWDQHTPAGRAFMRLQAAAVLKAALAGRTVIELPEPNFTNDNPECTYWSWWGRQNSIRVQLDRSGKPALTLDGGLKSLEDAEETAARLLAAVARVRSLASGSSDGGDTRG